MEEARKDVLYLSTLKETEEEAVLQQNVCISECVFLAVLISVGVIDRVVESTEQSD